MVWDPQRAIWQAMFAKLQDFVALHGHAKVPKGFTEDLELANWVRNQRLEYANQLKGKNTRMTTERVDLLNSVGFKWSTAAPTKFKIRRGTKKNPFKQRKNPSKQQQQLPLASPAQPYHQQPMAMTNEDIVDTDMSMEVAMGLACV